MMYLVLTALLALNVSVTVLDAFKIIDEGLEKTNETIQQNNEEIYSEFGKAMTVNPTKTREWHDKAMTVKAMADSLDAYIQRTKIDVLTEAEKGRTDAFREDGTIDRDKITAIEDYDTPARVMIGNELTDRSKARLLKNEIEAYRAFLMNIEEGEELPEQLRDAIMSSLNTEAPQTEGLKEAEHSSWEMYKFGHTPLMGFLAIMSSMQIDVHNAESEMINYLFAQISAGEVNFNELEAVVVASSNYVIRGNPYTAEVFLAARDTTQAPTVYAVEGVSEPWTETVDESGQVTYDLREGLDYQKLEVDPQTGKGIFTRPGSSVGTKQWGGIIEIQGPGGPLRRPFFTEYQVAEGGVVVSATKMNVFYLGVDNPVEISVPGVPSSQLNASITNGSIKRSGGGWIVSPLRQGTSRITVSADINGNRTQMGSTEFRVKTVPDPYATVAGQRSGTITKSVLLAQPGVMATMPEDFDFDYPVTVTEFTVVSIVGGFANDIRVTGNRFTDEVRNMINGLGRGQPVYIEDIKAVGQDGGVRTLPPINLKLN